MCETALKHQEQTCWDNKAVGGRVKKRTERVQKNRNFLVEEEKIIDGDKW